MPSLIEPILSLVRRRGRSVGTCAVCHRSVRERDERFEVRRGTRVHLACATYRMRAERAEPRRSAVAGRRSGLHVGD